MFNQYTLTQVHKFKTIIVLIIFFSLFNFKISAQEIKKIGKFKDWESFTLLQNGNKVCFAQSIPVVRAPKKLKGNPRLFVSFRPAGNIKNEVSVTNGYEFKIKVQLQQNQEKKI